MPQKLPVKPQLSGRPDLERLFGNDFASNEGQRLMQRTALVKATSPLPIFVSSALQSCSPETGAWCSTSPCEMDSLDSREIMSLSDTADMAGYGTRCFDDLYRAKRAMWVCLVREEERDVGRQSIQNVERG